MNNEIKFIIKNVSVKNDLLGDIFKKIESLLNIRFDENLKPFYFKNEKIYKLKEVSDWNFNDINKEIDSFFNFKFENVINSPLYKFLVLKNNEKLTILANIHHSIFDYTSINKFYEIFNNPNDNLVKNDFLGYYDDVNSYLSSSDFKRDSDFWNNHFSDAGNYVKFYKVKSDNYKNIEISFDNETTTKFLNEHDISKFNFFTAIFSLYLSRIDRTQGSILKTVVSNNFGLFDKNTYLKIKYFKDYSFIDYLKEIEKVYKVATENTKVDIDNYLKNIFSSYGIYDFTGLPEDVDVLNSENSVLTLNIYENSLNLVYNADVFSDVYMNHMAENIEFLIKNVMDCPNQLLKDINILSPNEKNLLSDFSKGKEIEFDEDEVFAKIFRRNALNQPDTIAVDDGVDKVSYGDLEKSSNSIANDLHENYGIGFGNHVALMLPRNYHFPELVLALNKLGAVFIPIDLLLPIHRIEYMINIAQIENIITTGDVANSNNFNIDTILIEDLNYDDEVEVDIIPKGNDLFSIMFTSGTTNIPKGVMVSNKQISNLHPLIKNLFDISPNDVIGCFLSFSFIASYLIFASLIDGCCCRIFNEREQKDILLLIKALKEHPMKHLILPPSVGIPIYENEDLKLDYLVLAGSKVDKLSKIERHTRLINFYGTTEIIVGIIKFYDLNDMGSDDVPIGRPIANLEVHILDKNYNQMPIGVPGEICISGEYISPGYYNEPELTSEVFVDDPYCDNKKMYRTGDIGFYNFDGEIEIIGREDNQLSVRGFRIESGEILTIMKKFKGISEIYLDVDHDNLIAFYTTNDEVDINDVKNALKMELPYYMIPSLFIELEKIPLNVNGKIDKIALKEMLKNQNYGNYIEDDTLYIVIDAFKEVLNQDVVLIDSDFVELGGNSLSAMNLQMLLKEKTGVTLSSNEIIELGTPANISNKIKYDLDIHSTIDVKYTFDDLCPLSESQLNVYSDEMVNETKTEYNNPFKIEFNYPYSVDEIKNAIKSLFEVYPVLSARVVNDNGDSYFSFDANPEIKEGLVGDIDEFVQPFELDKYLSRFLIVNNGDSTILCIDCHHLIFDGTSANILSKTFLKILQGSKVNSIDDGILRQISFEETSINQDYMNNAEKFFDEMLADYDETYDLLASVANDDSDDGEYIDEIAIDNENLNSFLNEKQVTLNQFFTSVFAYTLSRFTGSSKVSFDLIENGRGHIDLSQSVGMYVRTLPLIFDCTNQNIDSFMHYSRSLINGVMMYDLYPFRILAHEYDLNSNILFQYSHDIFSNTFKEGKFGYSAEELKHDMHGDMSFHIFDLKDNKMGIKIFYSDKFSKELIERFCKSYKLILKEIMNVTELSDITYTTQSDLSLLDSYNQIEKNLEYNDVLDAFNENLSKYPKNKLVSYNDTYYSYGEGAYIIDKISKKLIDLGIEQQDKIAFLVERSELYMFSVLSILSCGGVYVPLDDSLPDASLKFILKDSSSKIVIANDKTYERAKKLSPDGIILNISNIMDDEIGNLSKLPVIYGNLACILYTSGTTGTPKGVKITRKAILNLVANYVDKCGLNNGDVYGLFATIGFDAASQAICQSIYAGSCLSIVPENIRLNINELNKYFISQGVTHTMLTTQVGKIFMNTVENNSLKVLTVGGEKLGEFKNPADYCLVDAFGPTETFAFISSIKNSDKIDPSSIGMLNFNSKAYILDADGRQVPVGAVGELCLSGYQIADGYLNREKETNESFVINPFDESEDYNVLYHTGDMVRLLPDGSIAIVNRQDNQIKIRGNRVELSEIESVIRKLDFIEDVTVQSFKNNDNNELVAYVVVSDEFEEGDIVDYIQNHVRKYKPPYMVPSFVVKLDTIPLTVNGKVDKRALPKVDSLNLEVEYVAPTNEIEKQIVNSFEVAFNKKGIGLYDDFVRLGGNSITAIRVVSLLEKNNISCTARDILNYKTPYLIAQNIEKIDKISYDPTEGKVDLLPIQSYYFDYVNRNDFTQEFVLKSKIKLDLNRLQSAFNKLSDIHDMLRATYRHADDNIVQEILPLNEQVCEIKEYDTNNFNKTIKMIIKESKDSIDIENELIKISLVHCGDEDYLVFVIHHLIVDGVSWSILIDDLTYLYTDDSQNSLLRPYPYKLWVEDVKSLANDISDEEKQHWTQINNLLDDSLIEGNPKDYSFRMDVSFDTDNLLMLSEDEYIALAIARAYKKTYGKDIIFNRESHGRDESIADVGKTIGWFTSQFPVPVDVNQGYDNVSLMNDVYNIKNAFNGVKHLGLNYSSLIYTLDELEYKHCPVTYNFLSTEFIFKNELFESDYVELNDEKIFSRKTYGISINVVRGDEYYIFKGDYADDTYISKQFNEFVENIKYELKFIGEYKFDNYVCALSESQLGVYLDEKIHDKGNAYSIPKIFECGFDHSIEDIKNAITYLIDKHPVLKGRVIDGETPLLICDSHPLIEVVDVEDYSKLIKPFNLNESLARFYINENKEGKFIFYDIHHLINDATSTILIDKELSKILNGELDDTVDLGFIYNSIDSFNLKFKTDYEDASNFFSSNISGIDNISNLLNDIDGIENTIRIPIVGIKEKIESFCHKNGITAGNLFNAVFAYTYSRFMGNEKVYYTFTENGRHESYNQNALGMYVKTIPIIVNCENKSIIEFLTDTSDLFLDAMKYSFYPYRLLARKFDLTNDVTFEYNSNLNELPNIDDELIIENNLFDLVSDFLCIVNDLSDGILVSVSSSKKYNNDTIIRFLNSYKEILIQMLDKNELKDIEYTSNEDLDLLNLYNQTEHDLDYKDILEAFNNNLAKYPDNKLVSYNNVSYSYSEGAFISDKIARKLSDLNINSQDCVAFLVDRSEWYVFSVLGILSVGAIFVPLDDSHPDNRIEFIVKDTNAKVILTTDDTYQRAKTLFKDSIIINISDIVNEGIGHLNHLDICYGDVASILYTSGSTGFPKGVKVTRKSILNVAAYYADTYDLNNDDVYGLYPSIGFDAGCESIFKAIYAGSCLSIVPNDIKLNMVKLNEYFIEQNVTHTMITTQVGKLFMEINDNTSLNYLFVGGEKLGEIKNPENYILVDEYGPTETNNFITSIKYGDKKDYSSIGHLNYNSKVYILDSEKRPVPYGAIGELHLAGYQVSKGYLNRDEENHKSFIDNPFDNDKNYSKLYCTGDMVCMLSDGTLSILGRQDNQVKIRGNRVELSEVESTIRSIDYVKDVTIQIVNNNGNNELIAYIVTSKDLENKELFDSISNYVRERKPDYMVPSYVIKLDEIPLNINGKVDKHALPKVDLDSLHTEFVPPTTEEEKAIVDVFEEVFNQKGIGLYDDFIQLGGDSISAIRVVSLLQKRGIDCNARDILDYKTPYVIAQNISVFDQVSYDATEGNVDLLPIQDYFFDKINANNYSQEFILKSKINLNLDILQKAFDELTNVHDMLRVKYRNDNDEIIQEIMPINTHICKIKEYTIDNDFKNSIKDIIIELNDSLDINGELIKINLIHHEDDSYLVFVIHHLIIDGVSWSILINDLTQIYTQMVKDNEINLLRPYPYKLWVNDVKQLVENIPESEKQHWIKINESIDESSIKGQSNPFNFNMDIKFDVNNLLRLSEEEYLALSIARAYKKTYGKNIIFNRETHGRDESIANVAGTLGWFTSKYPVLVDVSNDYDNISLANDVYGLKTAFKDVNHLGLNYASLIYTLKELEYKQCPVTFNFLSDEFIFENELFKSINYDLFNLDELYEFRQGSEFYGITLNVFNMGGSYIFSGYYAMDTYIGDEFDTFVENIKKELDFIGNYKFDDGIVTCLSEPQIGIYLDEKVNDKGIAYSSNDILECKLDKSVNDIKQAIYSLIDKHPILKGRILDTADMPLLVCDSYPSIEVVDTDDYSELVKPFDLDTNLARFFIIDKPESKFIFYDLHHIISDASTRGIINKELNEALDNSLDDSIDLGFIYDSYDSFESKFESRYESAHEFFNMEFDDMDDVESLVDDIDGRNGSVSLFIPDVRERAEQFIRENGISIGNLLNSVFAYTYSRFTGSNKVYYNFTEHGRHESYNQNAVGMFIRTIPVIVDCKDRQINDYVRDVSDLILESMANSIYPFRLLVREFGLNNNVTFEYNSTLNEIPDIDENIVFSDTANGVSEFLCVVNDYDNGFIVNISHLDKISQNTAERFVNVFKEILVQILDKKTLKEIDYTSEDDKRILNKYNQTEYDLDYDDILDAFNYNLSKYPDNKLVSMEDKCYSYGEGAYIADKIAKQLIDVGVNRQDNVAFLLPRSEYYMFAVLGIMSMGGVYVPLDDKLPDKRIEFILEDCDTKAIIVSDETCKRAQNITDMEIVNISSIIGENIESLNQLPVVHDDLACILYTSGTTGIPKGVKITRKAILNISEHYIDENNLSNDHVYGLYASIGFDAASEAICQTFHDGACLSIIPEDVRLDMNRLNDYFINQGITHVMMTTQVAKLFMRSIDKTSLKVLKVGGEKLGEITNPSDYKVIDGYGPTETFAYITSIDNNDKVDYSSIGMLNYNTKAYVLDNEFRQVPYGSVGELYIAGYQVAKGYLNRDEETKSSFLENPFNSTKGYEVLYRSGDMVRFLPDGSLAIVGRRDNQVKIRGNRVELAEIESTIRELDYVDDVTVQTIKNESNNELVAYVVASDEIEDIERYVCDYVGENKPGYMVPSFVVKMDSIPLTVNGKVDKRSLPEVEIDTLRADYVAPKTEIEKEIVEAFQKVFNQEKISVYDDFIRLGGDSLTAIQLISYLEDYNITAGEILSLRTPHAISKNISKNQFNLDIYSLDSGCPLNEPQLNVYLDILVKNKVNSYIIPLFMEISKKYSVDDIIGAIEEMFNVHPILGMHVSDDYDVPYLVMGSKPPIIVKSQRDDEFIKSYLLKPFDLNGNLCRFLIIENNEKFELFASFHHIIFDAISNQVFKRDLQIVLDGGSVGIDDSFLKVSAFTQQIKHTEEYENANNFYKSMLDENDDVGILLGSVLPDGSGSIYVDLDLNSNILKSFIKENQITKNVLFTGVFAYTLSRFVANEQVLFNIVENGRDRFNNLNAIGMFVNTLPVLANCENQDVSSFMRYMSQLLYDITKYNYYSFRLLANEFNFDSNIIFQFIPDLLYDAENVVENDIDFENDYNLINDLNVNVIQNGEEYNLNINYSNKYSSDFINAFAESYKLILHEITNVDKLNEIKYISNEDIKILDEYNKTDKDLIYDDILDAFNDHLAKRPNSNLVSLNENHYTYSEGAFIADKIAKQLINMGISEKDYVAFLLPRSEYYMFAVLGIMSTGAVYVPLDDNLPDKRLEFILKDTASKVIIVSDETYNRVGHISKNLTVLNLSEIIYENPGNLSFLPVTYNNLACILYTSGTTGLPKGVKITRKAILNLSTVYAENYNFTNDDVYGLFANIGFDAASEAIFQTIYAGACLSIVPEDIKLNMSYLNDYFISQGVTHTMITTQVGRLFIKEIDETSLKVLTVGGEILGEVESPNYILVDGYGPTETFAFICKSMVSDKIHHSSVGLLNYNTKAYILDKEGRRVPIGAVGELYISGYQLANGYLNKNEETDKNFVKNPFDNSPKYNMLYRTGDLVRLLPDGSLGIVGRQDRQVKIRGNRVELSAVESIISKLDYVEDVTVQTFKNNHNNELVAYVVLSKEVPKFKESISEYISLNKPAYMVPSFIIELDEIPLTINGKVNKRELPKVEWDKLYRDYYGPTNKMEEIVIQVFEEVFNYEGISLFDDFTLLGGDSIIAIRVVSLLNDKSIHCNASDILKYKTPYLIAQNIGKHIEKISYDATEGEVELLPIQKYFFDYINKNKFAQNFILKISVDIDVDKLQQALNELVNIHDMLRAVYRFEGDTPIQEILPLNTRQYNINEYTIKENLEENVINILIDSLNSLNIQHKLIDTSLIKYGGEYYFIIVAHHLIIDGVSWNILLGDLTQIYFNLVDGVKIDLLRPYPYKNWVNDVKQLVNNISDEEKQHWIDVNNLLDDDLIKGDSRRFSFNAEIDYDADNLLMLSENEYLALAIARAYKKTYDKDIVFNVESYGRDESLANVSRTIGWFTSQYPVSIKISNGYDNISLMEDVYNLKTAFKDIDNLGLNYSSLIYTTDELEFKHCPVSFNFLSSEFIFKNKLFESMNNYLSDNDEIIDIDVDAESYGISFNISRIDNHYLFRGNYADGTYIGVEFNTFHENILSELKFIGNYSFKKEGIVCCLSEPQLGVYLDEKMHDKGISYSVLGVFECGLSKSIDEIEKGIRELIDKHPILKARILDTGDRSLLICDAYPSIEVVNTDDYSKLVKPFDLNKSLARFYIIENSEGKFVFYDMHHIISDATSVGILNKELNCAINGELNRDVDYGFVYAGSESFESKFTDEYKSAYEFFKDMLADIDDVAYLLEDVEGSAGSVTLPIRGIRNQVESFVKNKGVSLGSFLNSVFAYTYSRFTGGDKVYYNFTEHGRHHNYSQDALGMFVRTVPIVMDCKDRLVDEYLYDASNLILSALTNSFYPFRVLSNDFNLNNKVTFEYNRNLNDVSDVGDDITFSDFTNCVSEFLCVVNDLDDGFVVSVSHRDKFSQDTAERFAKVFKEVLMQFVEKENLRDINYISNNDIRLLNEYNQRDQDLTYNNVLDAFNDNLAKYPNNKLVYGENRSYSYGEGAYISDKIAKKLMELGVKAQDFVGFLVEKSENYVFNILAILSIGAVFVPLDDNHPDERIKFMLTDTKSKVLIVSDETYERALNLSLDITLLNINDIFNENIESLTSLPVSDGNLACILYTSGTTGIPKGVKITRKAIVNYLEGFNKIAELKKNDVFAMFSSIGFDAGAIKSILLPIFTGSCLTIIPEDIRLNIPELNKFFIDNQVTYTSITTPVAKLFIKNVDNTSLKVLTTGGEKLGQVNKSLDYLVIDGYGPTEGCVSVCAIEQSTRIDPSSVGHLYNNIKAYILDNEYRQVPVGAIGELYLSGIQIADGYLNRDEETEKAFINNPFDDSKDYTVMYRTGDLVRLLPDGSLGIVGRRDNQVKVRGNRIELSEVESTIRTMDIIDDVTVQTVNNNGNNEIVAYVVVSNDLEENKIRELIQDYVANLKPNYMVPSYVIKLDSIPLNVNGKVDKKSLPEVDVSSLRSKYVAARNETEKYIIDAFENVFNEKDIGIYDDFINMGGDSLAAIQIVSLLAEKDIILNANTIMTERTPYKIALHVTQNLNTKGFNLVKKGKINKNMFLIPAMDGLSIIFSDLIQNIDFEGNIYVIDDFRYELSLDEIKNTNHEDIFNYYYTEIKDLFCDGDIIAGYSLGCIYASLLVEKLEKDKKVDKCILIDGTLSFASNKKPNKEDIAKQTRDLYNNYDLNKNAKKLIDKVIEISYVNSTWNFHTPQINTHIIYLATSDTNKKSLKNISNNYEFIFIESNHQNIVTKDISKIIKYFK